MAYLYQDDRHRTWVKRETLSIQQPSETWLTSAIPRPQLGTYRIGDDSDIRAWEFSNLRKFQTQCRCSSDTAWIIKYFGAAFSLNSRQWEARLASKRNINRNKQLDWLKSIQKQHNIALSVGIRTRHSSIRPGSHQNVPPP